MVRCFFSLIHFLVVEDYELPTSHILWVPLSLEFGMRQNSILIDLYFSCLPDDVLCKIAI